MNNYKIIKNTTTKDNSYRNNNFSLEVLEKVVEIHKSITEYRESELFSLNGLSNKLLVSKIFVKDEASRFNLSSFKVLGGSYVVSKSIIDELNLSNKSDISFYDLHKNKTLLNDLKFVTATDGNHGRGVAWAANKLGYETTIFMPKGTSESRIKNIECLGAKVIVTDCNYDDTVRLAAKYGIENKYKMVQDTFCDGCKVPPIWIMQGYLTIAYEILNQLDGDIPTHIILQAGVGAFAGSIVAFFKNYFGDNAPKFIIVEAENSDCYYTSIKNNKLTYITGNLDTIMVGLACGEPNPLAWEILSKTADYFVVCSDSVAARGMRILGNPYDRDSKIVSGESGAVTTGLISLINNNNGQLRKELEIDNNSKVLLVNTEGDTDPIMYEEIVWNGKYSFN